MSRNEFATMSVLPDELWRQILEIGFRKSEFSFKDLCCISISCRRLHRLSNEDAFWFFLLSSDFPQHTSNPSDVSSKALYRIRFEREKERRLAAHRRAVLRKESQISEHSRKLREIEAKLALEADKLKATEAELSNLHKVRQASVALNVWQPEVIRGRQKQVVEQCVVPVETRIHAVQMELKLCMQQIDGFNKAYRDEKQRLEAAKEELTSMKYHPLRYYTSMSKGVNECNTKKKKLKTCINFHQKQKNIIETRKHLGSTS